MYSDKSFSLTEKQYNYLLPVFGISSQNKTKLLERQGTYFFIGTSSEYLDILTNFKKF